jgi:hypothetical protein
MTMKKSIKGSDIKKNGLKTILSFSLLFVIVHFFARENEATIIASTSLLFGIASLYFVQFPLLHSVESERVRNIEVKLEKFYIPLYNLLTIQNGINNYQDKINEINCYNHLAYPCTRSYFLEYHKKKGSDDELLDRIKIDIGFLQKEYIKLIEDISN